MTLNAGEVRLIGRPIEQDLTAAEEALAVIRRTSAERANRLVLVGEAVRPTRLHEDEQSQSLQLAGTRQTYGLLAIPLLGSHQTLNCATAVAALEASGLSVTPRQVQEGLTQTKWPGRFQKVSEEPLVVLDGAHNAAAAEKLAATLREHFTGKKLTFILGVLRDKNYDQMCQILAPLAEDILCVPVNSERSCDPDQLARWCKAANPAAHISVSSNVSSAYTKAAGMKQTVIVIAGSLFLVGEALDRLGFAHPAKSKTPKELVLQ